MTCRGFVMVCSLLMFAASPMLAQSGGAKSDAVSGTWAGELAPSGAPAPVSVTLLLKFDGKAAVSGTFTGLPNPGDVKKGTFDPKTGALKLQLGKKGESTVLLTLDGTVVKGVASGKFSGEMSGEFKLTKG